MLITTTRRFVGPARIGHVAKSYISTYPSRCSTLRRMSERPIKIVISGKVSYEDEITVLQAVQIIAYLHGEEPQAMLGPAPKTAAPTDRSSAESSRHKPGTVSSARDALAISGAKTNPEKIVALGEYILQDGGETFKVEDVKAQFRRARETPPANFSRDLSIAVQAGWIAEAEVGEYYTTSKVQGIFDGGFTFPKTANGVRVRSGTKSHRPKAEKPVVFASIDEFPTKFDGFPPYSKMKSGKDRLLWALQFAKTNGINGLVNQDIVWLTDHLGGGVATGHITGVFNAAQKAGYAIRSTQDNTLRITEDGTGYLKKAGASES